MPSSDWRAPAAYGHAKSISTAGFAWEFLRRDDDYHRDFHRMKALPQHQAAARRSFSERWGLRFPGRSAPASGPRPVVLDARAAA
ncbi:transcriptional regulator domain-containing protein [Nitratireductor soli]|uniref:transcriptional regulator domain-containing protein n=1 Tax=Nitratireductor soli TaxID=1670619 RepID=UPI0009E3D5EC|nr:DUF6499 domain-containing protein [Nitratireductor soli]